MPAATTITVNDRESSPVAHSFVPRDDGPSMYSFEEAAAVPAGNNSLVVRWTKDKEVHRIRLTMALPKLVTETINGVNRYSVDYVNFIDFSVRFSNTSTEQERKNAIGMFANALAASQGVLNPVLTQVQGIY